MLSITIRIAEVEASYWASSVVVVVALPYAYLCSVVHRLVLCRRSSLALLLRLVGCSILGSVLGLGFLFVCVLGHGIVAGCMVHTGLVQLSGVASLFVGFVSGLVLSCPVL